MDFDPIKYQLQKPLNSLKKFFRNTFFRISRRIYSEELYAITEVDLNVSLSDDSYTCRDCNTPIKNASQVSFIELQNGTPVFICNKCIESQ